MLTKEDPIYYKKNIQNLLRQSADNNLEVELYKCKFRGNNMVLSFRCKYTGDTAEIVLDYEGDIND